jgi:hypothetical protein
MDNNIFSRKDINIISEQLQLYALEGLTKYLTSKNIIFQGGSSLHFVWLSPRYSEDLDFFVSNDITNEKINNLFSNIFKYLKSIYILNKNVSLGFKSNIKNNIYEYNIYYTELNKRNKIRLKIELYLIKKEYIKEHTSQLEYIKNVFNLNTKPYIYTASVESIFADKLNALGTRQYIKYRDFFDIYFLSKAYNINLNNKKLISAIKLNHKIYNLRKNAYKDNFTKIVEEITNNNKIIKNNLLNDLQKWLSKEQFGIYKKDVDNILSFVKKTLISYNNIKLNNNNKGLIL